MASKKKESEGIALLSMYNDEEEEEEDEEMEDVHEEEEEEGEEEEEEEEKPNNTLQEEDEDEDLEDFYNIPSMDYVQETTAPSLLQSQTSVPQIEQDSTSIDDTDTVSPPAQILVTSPPPPQLLPPPTFDAPRPKKRALAIVDYAHDEAAMSPEAEEGEIMGTGHVMFGEDLEAANGNSQGITPLGTVQILTQNIQGTPPRPSEQTESLHSDSGTTMNFVSVETETTTIVETVTVSVEIQKDVNPLDDFLPPPPETMCSEELQEKINRFLALKRTGKSFNAEVRNRKDYRNPDFLLHAVRYQDIDQIGSCFSKDVFDPHGYDKSDFYDEIEADMKREMERKEQEKKRSQRLDFVAGGAQVLGAAVAQRSNLQNPVVPTVASTGFHSHPLPADSIARDGRVNKKSKWDKVDVDRKNPLHIGGQDAASTALLSANVGAGYTAFAQQKRREAEEKRSTEKRS